MSHPHKLLAPGALPVIGRLFEANAAEQHAAAGGAGDAPCLPFVAEVVRCQPGASITVARHLTLEEDRFLADHNFVHAPAVKPLAQCFPVVPLTVSLEIMAESAACLAPGYGLLGFETVAARRWIAVTDGAGLALRIEGRVLAHDRPRARARIAVQIYAGDDPAAAIDATVLFGSHHDCAPAPQLAPPGAGRTLDAALLYAERHLFHGPRFQGLAGPIHIGADGASAHTLVRSAADWFTSQPQPQLLTDPALLDTVGQLIAAWAMQQGHAAFPIGLGRLDLYGPAPAPGARLSVTVQIAKAQLKMLSAKVEIGDGAGGVWLRITDWKSWQFHWAPQLVEFQRRPAHCLLSDAQALAGAAVDVACQRMAAQRVAGFDLALLARHYLHASEWPAFAAKAKLPARQLEWLLGRIVAKDAARAWRARAAGGQPPLHPAAFAVVNDAAGQPSVICWPGQLAAPRISIAHGGGQAIALASAGPVGVDIERIAVRDAHCVAGFTSAAERRLLDAFSGAARAIWITRLWCAKEALGKRLGTGVAAPARQFEAQSLAADGQLCMRDAASGTDTELMTLQDGDFIIACATTPASH